MNRAVLAIGLLTIAAVGWLLLRGESDDERAVRAAVTGLVKAVEASDAEALAAFIAADYTDRLGHDADTVVDRALAEVEHFDHLEVRTGDLTIKIEEKSGLATAAFRPELVGDRDESKKRHPKYGFKEGQKLQLKFRKHGPDWLLVRADLVYSLTDML